MPRTHRNACLTLAMLALGTSAHLAHATPPEHASTLKDQKHVAVTIYNQDLALIKDSRRVTLEDGENRLAWRDVAARMRPETALLRATQGGIQLIEQNFDFDLLTPQKLLEKHVGRKLRVIKTNPASGAETSEEATLLSANEGAVLRFADRIESHPPGRLAFQTVPETLRDRPTLVIDLHAADGGSHDLELAYLSGGLSWKADYVAELTAKDDRLDLNGWVTLTNQSGTAFPNAKLQLVAGDVNRVRDEIYGMAEKAMPMAVPMPAPAPRMREENLFEYHLYTLDRPTTLAENQTKQVALLSAAQVPVKKEFLLRGADYYYRSSQAEIGRKLKVGVFVEFDNKGHGLGIPLPKGTLRVYKRDGSGNAQFIGEDRIDHTPKNETVRLKLGDAFDITADKKQTDFQKVAGSTRYNQTYDIAFQIDVKNAKNEPVMVKLIEPIPGDWEVLSESHEHVKEAANLSVWRIPVPAEGKTTLTYRVRVKL